MPSEKSIARWLSAMEVDVSRDDVKAEIRDLLALISVTDFVPQHEPAVSAVRVFRTGGEVCIASPEDGRAWVVAFDIAVWGLGAWAVMRRCRKPRDRQAQAV
jgi:hypothetical protein